MNEHSGTMVLRSVQAWLVNPMGERGAQVFRLVVGGRTIGRSATCDIVVSDPGASQEHARVVARTGDDRVLEFYVEDLNSTNGTWVNGSLVSACRLHDLDRVVVGSTVFVFRQL